jgi:DNA replication protein DnaC
MDEMKKPFADPSGLIRSLGVTVADEKTVAAYEERQRQQEEENRRERLLSHYRSAASGVPERYYNESLDTFRAETDSARIALEKTREFVASKKCRVLILCGANGTGKSHLGCGAVREMGGVYTTMLRLVYEVDSTQSFKAKETKIQLLDRLCNARLLVLDEIARMKVREEFQQELACYLLMERYARLKSTIVIGNPNKDGMLKWLGGAVTDRFRECAECVELVGGTYRLNKRKEVFDVA